MLTMDSDSSHLSPGSMDPIPSRRRLDSNTSEMSDYALNRLGDDVLINILARLPCESATRFKLVCKRWNSVISSDYFITLFNHILHNNPNPSSYKLLFQLKHRRAPEYEHYLLFPGLSCTNRRLERLDLGFLPCRTVSRIAVRASCADLILCSFEENLYMCNPRTEQWVALPPAPTQMDDYVAGLLCIPAPCSLCHTQAVDNSRYKFMVMRIRCHNTDFSQLEVELFSSEEGQWRNHLVSSPRTLDIYRRGNIVPYKGMLHWLNYPYVLVFDPFNAPGKISRVIDIEPNNISAKAHNIDVCCGRLCVSYSIVFHFDDAHHYILELEDYEMGKWSLVHKLNPVDPLFYNAYVHPDGNAVTTHVYKSSLLLCNLITAKEATDLNYEKIVPGGQGLLHNGIDVYHIEDKCWPTPVPSQIFC